MGLEEIVGEIQQYMSYDEFLKIQERLEMLRAEERNGLAALAELQQAYLSADTDEGREMVKRAVAQVRELSKAHRHEIRSLIATLQNYMSLEKAKELFDRLRGSG